MKKIFNIVIGIIVGVALMIIYFNIAPTKNTQPTISPLDLEGKIADIGELATAEYVYTLTEIADKEEVKVLNIKIPFTSSKIIFGYSGVIKAGLNYSDIKIELDEDNKEIIITLPETKILSNELDNDSLVIFDSKDNIFNHFTFEDVNTSQAKLKEDAQNVAIEKGLLDTAKENSKTLIENTIFALVDIKEYKIIYK